MINIRKCYFVLLSVSTSLTDEVTYTSLENAVVTSSNPRHVTHVTFIVIPVVDHQTGVPDYNVTLIFTTITPLADDVMVQFTVHELGDKMEPTAGGKHRWCELLDSGKYYEDLLTSLPRCPCPPGKYEMVNVTFSTLTSEDDGSYMRVRARMTAHVFLKDESDTIAKLQLDMIRRTKAVPPGMLRARRLYDTGSVDPMRPVPYNVDLDLLDIYNF